MFDRKEYKAAFSKVTASQDTYERIMEMQNQKPQHRKFGFIGKALIAAVLVSILAVTASAAESSWFTHFFGARNELSQEQVAYLEDKTQKIDVESSSNQKTKQPGHIDVLQFVRNQTVCSADQNNTHITGEGQPSFHDIKLDSLTLTETEAKLYYYYYEDMDTSKPCSILNITVVMDSGEEIVMPITASTRIMTFTSEKAINLNHVSYIRLPDGLILYPVNKVDDGYDVTLDSVMTDGTTAYITLNVTIPEHILSPGEGWILDEMPTPHIEWICPADLEKPDTKQLIEQSHTSRQLDDGDNNENTYKLVFDTTFLDGSTPFASGSQWKLHIDGFSSIWHNAENQKMIDDKYAGQDYLIDGEEAAQVVDFRNVCWDTWEFVFSFEGEDTQIKEVEFVSEPIAMSGRRSATIDELLAGLMDDDLPAEASLVSLRISPLSYYIEYQGDDSKWLGSFNPGDYWIYMKNGKVIKLFPYQGRHNFEEPIILTDIDYLLLPNGDRMVPNT